MFPLTLPFLVFVAVETMASREPQNGSYRRQYRLRHEVPSSNVSWDAPYSSSPDADRRVCDTQNLEYRLTRLESQMAEGSENMRSELRENSHRLQSLEWQSTEVQTALQQFRSELGPLAATASHPRLNQADRLESRIDNLAKGIQLVVATLRGINSEIAAIKRNVSNIAHQAKLTNNQQDTATNPFLVNQNRNQVSRPSRTQDDSYSHSIDTLPKNCKDVQNRGYNTSGVYRIQPELGQKAFMVLCDMTTKDGGWTYIHNRYEGSQDFYLNWQSYEVGFGNLGGEFWLGLDYLHQLTGSELNELLIELVDENLTKTHAHYTAFSIGDKEEGYSLKVLAGYSGDAGDSLIYHAGSKFSTKDKDQDGWPEGSCAQAHGGAWWYKNCDTSNLNGRYIVGALPETYLYQGIYWGDFHGPQYGLSRARMLIRPQLEL